MGDLKVFIGGSIIFYQASKRKKAQAKQMDLEKQIKQQDEENAAQPRKTQKNTIRSWL